VLPFAVVFPGQGSQSIGMLAKLAAHYPIVRETFDEAASVLGLDLWRLVSNGPASELNMTEHTQPAMLAAGIATWKVWRQEHGALPLGVSGHSLGEFTALVCANALDFRAAVALVQARGRLMQAAVPAGAGAMAAVLGLDDAEVEAACAQAAQGEIVEAVNYNSPGQVVIAGHAAAVQRAVAQAKARGAKRAVMLPVSVPAHSSLLREAALRLQDRLVEVEIRAPELRYVSAVDGAAHSEPDDIRAVLVRQLASPVRWSQTIGALSAAGARVLVECGPGKVLTGLNRRIERGPDIQCLALEEPQDIAAGVAAVTALQAASPMHV
jgi:[acyl-carrier-protein] S-malonyltransferase